ncbi:MAG: sigma-70 family RNA polymerase sigma factor [Acidobacteria bacterium]|nr:sigma-70 family RNA polymerase sigma factor [Acidobacteriota bacterium]
MALPGEMSGELSGELPECEARERLERLYDRYSARLFRFALRMAVDDGEARDFVHDAFVRAARGLARVPAGEEAMAWLMRVVVNLARDRHRRRVVRAAFARLPFRVADDPRAALETAGSVRAALAELPPRQRAIIALHHFDDEPVAAIAATLGLSAATVRWHLAKGRKRLAELLKGLA